MSVLLLLMNFFTFSYHFGTYMHCTKYYSIHFMYHYVLQRLLKYNMPIDSLIEHKHKTFFKSHK